MKLPTFFIDVISDRANAEPRRIEALLIMGSDRPEIDQSFLSSASSDGASTVGPAVQIGKDRDCANIFIRQAPGFQG